MSIACPACDHEVDEKANYCAQCGASLIAPTLAKAEPAAEAAPEPEEAPQGNWFHRVFRLSKTSRPGSWFSWSFDVEFTTSTDISSPPSQGDQRR